MGNDLTQKYKPNFTGNLNHPDLVVDKNGEVAVYLSAGGVGAPHFQGLLLMDEAMHLW